MVNTINKLKEFPMHFFKLPTKVSKPPAIYESKLNHIILAVLISVRGCVFDDVQVIDIMKTVCKISHSGDISLSYPSFQKILSDPVSRQ